MIHEPGEIAYRQLFESIDEGFLVAEVLRNEAGAPVDLLILECNAAATRMLRIDPAGKRLSDVSAELNPYWLDLWQRVSESGVGERIERYAPALDTWFDFYVVPLNELEGRAAAVLFRDITDRKRGERHTQLLSAMSDDFARLTTPEVILEHVATRLSGYLDLDGCNFVDVTDDELIVSYSWVRPPHPSAVGRYRLMDFLGAAWVEASRAGETMVVRDTRHDRRTNASGWANLNVRACVGVPFHRQGQWTFLLMVTSAQVREWRDDEVQLIHDVLERLYPRLERARAEMALEASETRYRTLVDNIRDYAICMIDRQGDIIEWTDGAERLMGYSEQEALGRPIAMLFTPDEIAAGEPERELATAHATGRAESESWRLCKDGRRIFVNEVVSAVRDPHGEIVSFTKITRDLTERWHATAALSEADRRKDEFLATLAHELRNPLAPLRNGLHLARLSVNNPAAIERVVGMMDRQLSHLVRLVDDLLDVGRISAGKLELRVTLLPLAQVLSAGADIARTTIDRFDHHFTVDVSKEPMFVHGDEDRLVQVFANLLSNAAKYTAPGGHIDLRAYRDGTEAVVEVEDNGIGIPADDLPHVFDLFSQVRIHQGRAEGGLGIGLALVRTLVEMHSGTVTAASAGHGRGSCFTVRLPLVPQ
jgi:PAS domain S-box-containing protein